MSKTTHRIPRTMHTPRISLARLFLVLVVSTCLNVLCPGCGGEKSVTRTANPPKTMFVLGDPTFSAEHEEADVHPHHTYSGWACIRYGIGETLFRYTDDMTLVPWLAESVRNIDPYTWEITLKPHRTFSNGKPADATAVKKCLTQLIETHARARADLAIASIEIGAIADSDNNDTVRRTLTIRTHTPKPTLPNALADPYACIIDVTADASDGTVIGTGPYAVISMTSGKELLLTKNTRYTDSTAETGKTNTAPGYDEIRVRTITDGDTRALALQAGEIDAAYALPYATHALFEGGDYSMSQTPTSRAFFAQMNFNSPILQDIAVRRAIARGIDKNGFVRHLLRGNATAAAGPFPATLPFGGDAVRTVGYTPEIAKQELTAAGWVDSDGDGIREKDGQKLVVRWLTYPSRAELPLLAEYAQATLKELGIDVIIQNTAAHNTLRKDRTAWDVYASAMVTAPTGDPQMFFATHTQDAAPNNNGAYHSERLTALYAQLAETFDPTERAALAMEMQQRMLDDYAFVFVAHLKMTLIAKKSVAGFTAHPTDFYEITANLQPAQ